MSAWHPVAQRTARSRIDQQPAQVGSQAALWKAAISQPNSVAQTRLVDPTVEAHAVARQKAAREEAQKAQWQQDKRRQNTLEHKLATVAAWRECLAGRREKDPTAVAALDQQRREQARRAQAADRRRGERRLAESERKVSAAAEPNAQFCSGRHVRAKEVPHPLSFALPRRQRISTNERLIRPRSSTHGSGRRRACGRPGRPRRWSPGRSATGASHSRSQSGLGCGVRSKRSPSA